MKTKDQNPNLILDQVLGHLKRKKRKIKTINFLIALVLTLPPVWAVMKDASSAIVIILTIFAIICIAPYLWVRSELFEISDKRKNLQLLDLAISKTKQKIPYIDYFGIDSGIDSYILDLAPSKNRAALYVTLKSMVLNISIEMEKKNEENILYVSPLLEELMILFFQEIAMLPTEKKEKYLEEIKKLDKFFSRF